MNLSENLVIALSSIRANWLRTILTLLIIAFGIMALVGILTAIDSIKGSLVNNFASMGTNTFNVIRKGTGISGRKRGQKRVKGKVISYKEAKRFKDLYDYPALVSISALGSTMASAQHKDLETNPNMTLYGVDENYLKVAGYALEVGRNFTQIEAESGRKTVIIGKRIADKLFPGQLMNSICGQRILVRNIQFEVIGVLKEKGASLTFSGDKMLLIPLPTLRQYIGNQTQSFNISVAVQSASELAVAMGVAEGTFRNVRRIELKEPSDFSLEKSDGIITLIVENTERLQLAAIFIGLVTLLGAAIGLMNIMLVSVTERTREIGICKSLGATPNTILLQFLTEAIFICQLGGLLGVGLGILVGNGLSLYLNSPFIIPWAWITLGLVLCFLVGLASGIYPAYKASRLDPIESLRYE